MAHADFGPFSSVNIVKGRAELLSDPVSIMTYVKEGLHQTPSNSAWAYKIRLENAGRRVKGKESCRQTLFSKKPVTADSVGAQGSLFGEQRKGNHCWRGKELHCTSSVRTAAWDHRQPGCEVLSTISTHVPSRLLQTAACLVLLVSWINQTQKASLWFTHVLPWFSAEEHQCFY